MQIGYSKDNKNLLVIPEASEKFIAFNIPGLQRKKQNDKYICYTPKQDVSRGTYLHIKMLLDDKNINTQCSYAVKEAIYRELDVMQNEETEWKNNRSIEIMRQNETSDAIDSYKRRFYQNDTFSELGETYLMNHQKAGLLIAKRVPRFAFFFDTGTGKTAMALEILSWISAVKRNSKFLIICPKSIIQTAWMADCKTYTPDLRILPLCKGLSNSDYTEITYRNYNICKSRNILNETKSTTFSHSVKELAQKLGVNERAIAQAQHYITNPEYFINNRDAFYALGITGLIFDESAKLKNQGSTITHYVNQISAKLRYVYLLSGKPAPNNSSEYFSQMRIIDPFSFYMSYDCFKKRKFIPAFELTKYRQYNSYKNSLASEQSVAEMIQHRSFTVSKKECFDLPAKTFQIKYFTLNDSTYQKYQRMEYQYYSDVKTASDEGRVVSVTNHLAGIRKLQQISSGFLKDVDEYFELENNKLDLLMDTLEELEGKQVVIWCQYRHEIESILSNLRVNSYTAVTAYGGTDDVNKSIRDFKDGTAQYLIAHPRTIMYGVTLVNCSYSIYYSISYSFEEFYQSHDRIYRYGQSLPCTYLFLQAEHTIDQAMYRCVMDKKSNTELYETILKDIAKRHTHLK